MTRAVIYTRFSPRPDAEECDSCEKQLDRCRVYCNRNGYPILANGFSDKAISGGDLSRPGLDAAIDILEEGDILVVDRPDRLARDTLVFLTIRHKVEERGARIEFADGTMPADSPEGRLMQSILAAFAAYERDRIRARTKAGLARKREAGVHLGPCPYGYKRGRGKMLIKNHGEMLVIKRITEMHVDGFPDSAIAKRLNDVSCDMRGKPWTARRVKRILEREGQ